MAFKSYKTDMIKKIFENLNVIYNPDNNTRQNRILIFNKLKELSLLHYENFNEQYYLQEPLPTKQPKIILPGECGPPSLQPSPDVFVTPIPLSSPNIEPMEPSPVVRPTQVQRENKPVYRSPPYNPRDKVDTSFS
jgi:hypothetical protein